MWLHVDGAMCGIAALVPEHRWVNAGLERADSYCTNPHKWMGVNFDCDLFWVADRRPLLGALSILPEYLRIAGGRERCGDRLPRLAGAPRTPLPFAEAVVHLRIDGVEPVQEMIREHVRLTQMLAELVDADERFEIVAPHPLNLLCLAVRDGDAATDRLIEDANATGERAVHAHGAATGVRCCDSRSGPARDRGASCARRRGACCRNWPRPRNPRSGLRRISAGEIDSGGSSLDTTTEEHHETRSPSVRRGHDCADRRIAGLCRLCSYRFCRSGVRRAHVVLDIDERIRRCGRQRYLVRLEHRLLLSATGR